MSPMNPIITSADQRFPRVSGDEPARAYGTGALNMFSPRERG